MLGRKRSGLTLGKDFALRNPIYRAAFCHESLSH